MNGRVYDPLLGRFGTPDPMTENPFSTQGWNRYSYVGNSPLNFIDPSGYCFAGCFWQKPFKALGKLFRNVPILGNLLTIAAAIACGPAGPICAGLASAAVTGLASGNLGLALRAGFIATATAYAFQIVGDITGHTPDFGTPEHIANIAGHAAVGCGSAVASGSKCGPGALSGAVGSFSTPLTKGLSFEAGLAITTTAGGLASVAGGGKFGNGAVTAAFGYLYNAWNRANSDQAKQWIEKLKETPQGHSMWDAVNEDSNIWTVKDNADRELSGTDLSTHTIEMSSSQDLAKYNFPSSGEGSVNYGEDLFRAFVHEVGHAVISIINGVPYARTPLGQDGAIMFENTVARELNPNALQRSDNHFGNYFKGTYEVKQVRPSD